MKIQQKEHGLCLLIYREDNTPRSRNWLLQKGRDYDLIHYQEETLESTFLDYI